MDGISYVGKVIRERLGEARGGLSDLLGDELEETLHIIRAEVLQVALELGLPCVEEFVASGGCSLDERADVIAMLLG